MMGVGAASSVLALALAALPLAGATAWTETGQADAELQRLRDDFAAAASTFNSIDQADSIAGFSRLITVLQRRVAAGDEGDARQLLAASLAYRARANFNTGASQAAEADMRALITEDPAVILDRAQVSLPFMEAFDTIYADMVGYFEFEVSPVGAEIRVDGRLLEPGVAAHAVVAGMHSIVVERAGYQTVQEELQMSAGDRVLVDHALVRLSAVIKVLTRPAGAQVSVNGTPLGTTRGTAPADFSPTGEAALYPGSEFSDELEIEGLQPGAHTIEVSLDGYRTRRFDLNVADLADYRAAIVLEATRGTVVLEGLPDGAEVTVDGAGVTPQRPGGGGDGLPRLELPPGPHTVEVSQGSAGGVFVASVEVVDGQAQTLQVRLRPGLAFLGVLGGDERGVRDLSELLVDTLRAIDNWTLLDRTWASPAFAGVGLTAEVLRVAAERPTSTPDWPAVQAEFDRQAPGSVYMIAVLNDDLLATHADLWIWSAAPGSPQPDVVRVRIDSSADIAALASGFKTSTFLSGTWVGAQMVDVGDRVIVTSVSAAGPAEAGGLMVGDRVISIAGANITGAAAARGVIDAAAAGTVVAVQVQRGAATQVVEITLGSSPRVIPFSDPDLVYSVISASLAAERTGDSSAAPDWVVQLNQAAVLMHAGAWEDVVRMLRGIEDAPVGTGVGQATVDYWLGIALTALGPNYGSSAIQAFQRAAADPNARLFHNDGPWVAPRAAARLVELGGR